MLLNMTLEEIYLDYVNNFITIERMAEYYDVSVEVMSELYRMARILWYKKDGRELFVINGREIYALNQEEAEAIANYRYLEYLDKIKI